ncbi:hypothetical protein [Aliamphritea hakodatensis]|uniref:hypothetical protein n=1 Tax=Aliamphritea hakodatensis TaxID=2895352 RepID=UPI0022FD678E|nr:hypothetical protein [Aliamphritea hakodatensis]
MLYTLLKILLVIHLAGVILGFIGGRVHGALISWLETAPADTAEILWRYEKSASYMAFLGTSLLIITGILMLVYKWGGLAGQDWLFWVKMVLVAAVGGAEIVRHITAVKWRQGDQSMLAWTKNSGKFSGIAAVLTVIVGVFNFN